MSAAPRRGALWTQTVLRPLLRSHHLPPAGLSRVRGSSQEVERPIASASRSPVSP